MPSLVGGREMNNFDYDRGGQMNGMIANGGFDHYRDDFDREDMRRDEDERYRRAVRNGGPSFERFNTDYLDQNSLSDFRSNEPKFELDHLATFAAGTRNGVIHAEDGLRKLRQMENTTGIWTMRCLLIVERSHLVILDNGTGEELERFPIQLVHDPTAIFKNDRREIYNNLILFTIVDDPKKRSSQADMHIFQSSKAPAQEIVDEILAAKNGHQRLFQGGGSRATQQVSGAGPDHGNAYNFKGMRELIDSRQYQTNNTTMEMRQFNQTSYSQGGQFGGPISQQRALITRVNSVREREYTEGGSTEILERDVQLLNHCFDDIEKFVARLQQAAESYKELEKRKRDRGAKNKKKQSGDGMLNARARPPPDRDFVDVFQKFKLSFNLLAKLKAHIHDPNAPELVHFLFTPLSLIYEASRDPYHGNQNLADQAVGPVITGDAKQLLLNCLTSKEIMLWQALGKNWTTNREEWQGPIPPYVPEFYDGWQPAAAFDELALRSANVSQQAIMAAPLPMIEPARPQPMVEERRRGYNALHGPIPFPDEDDRPVEHFRQHDDFDRFEPKVRDYRPSSREFDPLPPTSRAFEPPSPRSFDTPRSFEPQLRERSPPHSGIISPYTSEFVETHHMERNIRQDIPKSRDNVLSVVSSRHDENSAYLDELKRMRDAIIYEAVHDRVGKNAKELSVEKGDVLQVLENSKNWWRLRNYKGEVGFAPYTILKPVKAEEEERYDRNPHAAVSSRLAETSFLGEDRELPRRDQWTGQQSYIHQHPGENTESHSQPQFRRRQFSSFRQNNEPYEHQDHGPPSNRMWTPQPVRRTSQIKRNSSFARKASPPHDQQASPTLYKPNSAISGPRSSVNQKHHSPSERRLESSNEVLPFNGNGLPTSHRRTSSTARAHEEGGTGNNASLVKQPSFRNDLRAEGRRPRMAPPNIPDPPVPPLPKEPRSEPQPQGIEGSSSDPRLKNLVAANKARANLYEELHAKVALGQKHSFKEPRKRSFKQPERTFKITPQSSAPEVTKWLTNKGFSDLAKNAYKGYTGWDLFQLHLNDIKEVLGHEEAIRLDGLITLQKTYSGYATKSAKELNDILRVMKQNCEPEDTDTETSNGNLLISASTII